MPRAREGQRQEWPKLCISNPNPKVNHERTPVRTPIWPIQKLPKGLTVSTQVFRHEQCFGPLQAALVWDSETRTQSPLMQES